MKPTHYKLRFLTLLLAMFVVCVAATTYAGEQAYLGVILQPLTVDLKESMDVKRDLRGVLISDIIDESPAEKYGLEDGDIIIEIGGDEVVSVKSAVSAIKSCSPGDEVKIVVLRDGDEKKVFSVTLGEREEEEEDYESFDFEFLPHIDPHLKMMRHEQGYLGVRLEDISTSDLGDYFGVEEGEGVLVVEVVDDSPAEKAGLKAGDVILEFDGNKISSTDQLVKYVRKADPGEDVEVTYKRKRRTKTIEIELGKTDGPTSLFIGGPESLRKHQMKKLMLPDIKDLKNKIKAHHKEWDDDDWIWIEKDDLDDMEGDIEIYRMDRSDLEDAMEDLKEEMEELRKELKELKKLKE